MIRGSGEASVSAVIVRIASNREAVENYDLRCSGTERSGFGERETLAHECGLIAVNDKGHAI